MLILIGIVPGIYALNLNTPSDAVQALETQAHAAAAIIAKQAPAPISDPVQATNILTGYIKTSGAYDSQVLPALAEKTNEIATMLDGHKQPRRNTGKKAERTTRGDLLPQPRLSVK